VPLLFYLFDRFAEGDDRAPAAPLPTPSPPTPSPEASAPAAPASIAPTPTTAAPGAGGAPRASQEDV